MKIMGPVELKISAKTDAKKFLIEQGIPIEPIARDDVHDLRIIDENDKVCPATIEHDGRDYDDNTVWVRVSTVVDGKNKRLYLASRPDLKDTTPPLSLKETKTAITVKTDDYTLECKKDAGITLSTKNGEVLSGNIDFQFWADARSIIGGGSGTCRLAWFVPEKWETESVTDSRATIVLTGSVPKFERANPKDWKFHEGFQFDCELELICLSHSPVIRYRWRNNNHTAWQAYLERYACAFPLAGKSEITDGKKSDDGKYLDYVQAKTPGGKVAVTANFVEAIGPGAGINTERRENMGKTMSHDDVEKHAKGGLFEPHKYLHAKKDEKFGLNVTIGGINPPMDGNMAGTVPEVHRLFYIGMGKTFEGSIIVNGSDDDISSELTKTYFELHPDHYSITGALPENGDPVYFGKRYKTYIKNAAEWMLDNQWKGCLWAGEWWRGYDVFRGQGTEATANANCPAGPLNYYFRTGDSRYIPSAKMALDYVYDVQLSKRRGKLGPFFQCRRFLIDKMEWIHMRYQRLDGPIKAAHFFGDTRVRNLLLKSMQTYANNLVCPNGAPGYGQGGEDGYRVPAGGDCTNFGEALMIIFKELGDEKMLEHAKKMARWTIRDMSKWDWDSYVGNSYGWHFLMRGMLQTLKYTRNKRMREWYLDMARKNLTYPVEEIEFVYWMDWLLVEAEKMSGETWMLDELVKRTETRLAFVRKNGNQAGLRRWPETVYPSYWYGGYDGKLISDYLPVLAARRKALGLPD